jgi:hypothetical protein
VTERRISTAYLAVTLGAICVGMILLSVWAAPGLGDQPLPVHWDLAGHPDNFASARVVLAAFPIAASIFTAAAVIGSRIVGRGRGLRLATFATLVILVAILAAAEAAIVTNGLQNVSELPRTFVAATALVIVGLGAFLIRSSRSGTSDSLNPRSTRLDQKAAGWAYIVCGIVLGILTFVVSTTLLPAAILTATLIPALLAVGLGFIQARRL